MQPSDQYNVGFLFQLNPELSAFQRKFVSEVRLCDEMDRILRYMEGELHKEGIKPAELDEVPDAPQPKEIRDIHVSRLWLVHLTCSVSTVKLDCLFHTGIWMNL